MQETSSPDHAAARAPHRPLHAWRATLASTAAAPQEQHQAFRAFVAAITAWQARHGFSGHWRWPALQEALRRLDAPATNAVLATLRIVSEEGATPFERVKNGLAALETFTPRLIAAMQRVAEEPAAAP